MIKSTGELVHKRTTRTAEPACEPVSLEMQMRACEVCGRDQSEALWSKIYTARTRYRSYWWPVTISLCHGCGFCFANPAPSPDTLEEYYRDSFVAFEGQPLDYSAEKRMAVIRRHGGHGTYLEIGSNAHAAFAESLTELYTSVITVELNETAECSTRDAAELPARSAHTVASYFVLEHVPLAGAFLSTCRRLVSCDGIVIVEVPNLTHYAYDPVAFALHEHVNHFTPATLTALAARNGLRLVEVSFADCSRPYGFVAVFRPTESTDYALPSNCEVEVARAAVLAGVKKLEAFEEQIRACRGALEKLPASGRAVVWGANDICLRLLDGWPPPQHLIVVDSDPKKARYLGNITVHLPDAVLDEIRAANYVAVLSRRHASAIQSWISERVGPSAERRFQIIDY